MPQTKNPAAGKAAGLSQNDQLGGDPSNIKSGLARTQGGVALYNGERLLGFLIQRRHGTDAVLANGLALGHFDTEAAAASAIIAHARRPSDA